MSSDNENEWFKKHEILLISTAKREREKRLQQEKAKSEAQEAARLRELHWMHCPKCGHKLEEIGEQGIKIDRCNHCHGVYLDAGELEEILVAQDQKRKSVFRSLARMVTGGKLTD
ncbi:MAG: zf-TFIIB domain-containing protein [Acidobacteria bacterium]|nr:zf-TFIIB domain-containing protein [Acidobacteriota bacterium]